MRKRLNRLLARITWWLIGGTVVSVVFWMASNYPYLTCLVIGALAVESVLAISRYLDGGGWTRLRRVGDVSVQERWERKKH